MAQILDLGKIRFQFKGEWTTTTEYQFNDVVSYKGNAYVYISTAKTSGTLTSNTTFWGVMSSGFNYSGAYQAGSTYANGSVVRYNGSLYYHSGLEITTGVAPTDTNVWTVLMYQDSTSNKVYYVAPHGTDTAGSGTTLAQPFASIKYATLQAGEDATIFVKTGTYSEQLPITVPANTAIVGDNQRTVVVQPAAGLSDDGTTPNNQASMFLMSNGSILNKMTFKGMTGWVPGTTADDVTTSTIKGVVVRLNPASPVTHKSPYVLECSFIGSGAIGALIDGSVHAVGAKTMIFHGYTVISDNGIGYWVKDGGKSEIVSCFTYYCHFGYTASGGGFIRALNGNNSYGTWGATARGFAPDETPLTGAIVGEQLPFTYTGGLINIGDTVSNGAGATATVTNVQYSADKVYIKNRVGTFTGADSLTFTSGGTGTALGAAEDQRGFVLVANGFSALPKPGASISLAGDTFAYVIQSTTGTYTNSASDIVLFLSQEKTSGSAAGTAVTIRYKYSQIRLTGHDFLSIGTGGTATTNYPGEPTQPPAQGNETDEAFPGRVFYVSTDQDGNFRVGEYFRIDQATGKATLNASAFDLSGLSSLRLGSIGAQLGEQINEFSSDATMSGNSNLAVPTEYAVKTYVDTGLATKGDVTLAGVQTLTNKTISASKLSGDVEETAVVSATAATGTINFDVSTSQVLYYTSNATGNFTVNLRGNGTATLNSLLDVGDVVTAVFMCTNGGTAYYQTGFRVDGSIVTPKWSGGTAPSSGNASSIDIYAYTVIKTGSAAFTVLASLVKFA